MYKTLLATLSQLHSKQAPATGIGLFRLFYGLVTLQEIIFLLYFNHLIFDPIPYIDVEFPTTDGRTLVMSRHTQPDAGLQLLMARLGKQFPEQPPPRLKSATQLEP